MFPDSDVDPACHAEAQRRRVTGHLSLVTFLEVDREQSREDWQRLRLAASTKNL